jgi:hypothetical protein
VTHQSPDPCPGGGDLRSTHGINAAAQRRIAIGHLFAQRAECRRTENAMVNFRTDEVLEVPNELLDNPKTRKTYAGLTDVEIEIRNQRTTLGCNGRPNVYSEENLDKIVEHQRNGKGKSGLTDFKRQAQGLADKDKEWQKFLKEEEFEKKLQGVLPSRIIIGALTTLLSLQEFAGASIPFGGSAWKGSPSYPYQGDCFKEGSQDFTEVAALLQMAAPASWQGEAADAYTAANSTLVTLAQTMADLDLEMQKLVKDHAEVVSQTQLGIGIQQDVLIVALPIMFLLEKKPETFTPAFIAAITIAGAALLAAVGLLSWCLGTSIQTQQAVDGLAYGDVIAAAQAVVDPSVTVSVPLSTGSVASDFAPVSGSVPVSSAISGAPSVASSPGSASGWGRTPLHASTGDGQRVGVDSPPQVVATPDPAAPVTPGAPMMAQVRQPSGQAANRSGSYASPGNRINRQAGQATPEDAVRAGDSEDAGAGSGTWGAERAPIDGAAEQAPASTPAPVAAL